MLFVQDAIEAILFFVEANGCTVEMFGLGAGDLLRSGRAPLAGFDECSSDSVVDLSAENRDTRCDQSWDLTTGEFIAPCKSSYVIAMADFYLSV